MTGKQNDPFAEFRQFAATMQRGTFKSLMREMLVRKGDAFLATYEIKVQNFYRSVILELWRKGSTPTQALVNQIDRNPALILRAPNIRDAFPWGTTDAEIIASWPKIRAGLHDPDAGKPAKLATAEQRVLKLESANSGSGEFPHGWGELYRQAHHELYDARGAYNMQPTHEAAVLKHVPLSPRLERIEAIVEFIAWVVYPPARWHPVVIDGGGSKPIV